MKKTNRLTALIVAFAMLMSMVCFTVSVSAEETTGFVSVSEEDIALGVKLKVLGVITNEFEMSQYVTRGQMASIAAKYVNVPGATDKQAFADVAPDHPYYGVINALYNMGVITGDENGNFNPDDYVTYDEALVYIINAVGYKPFAAREGGYPTGYHRIAIKHDMLSELSMNKGTDKATLADIYKMIDKSLTAAVVVSSYYGDDDIIYTLSETETFLSNVYKIKQYRGIITGIPGTRLTAVADDIKKDQIEINGKRYDLYGYPEFNMLGYSVDFYVSTEEPDVILHIEETSKRNSSLRIDADDLLKAKTTDTRIYYTDDNGREYHIDMNLNFSMIYNNQYYDMYGVLLRVLPDNGYIEALDNNNDGEYDILYIFTYRNVMVANISSDGTTIRDAITDSNEDLSDDDQVVNVYFGDSRRLTTDSVQVGDVLSIVESKQSPVIKSVYISRNVIAGKIESFDSEKGYCINGEWYKAAVDYDQTGTALTLGLIGSYYLDMNGDIAYYERDTNTRNFEVGLMTGLNYELGTFENKITIRVYTKDDKVDFLDINKKVKVNGVKYDLTKREDAECILGLIAGTPAPGEVYAVKSVYATTYVVNSEGFVSELDLGRTADSDHGVGKLNVLASNDIDHNVIVRSSLYNVMDYTNDEGTSVTQRVNPKNSWVISVPMDEEIDDFDSYKKFSFTSGYAYGPAKNAVTGGSVNDEYIIGGYDIYSFEETDIPMIDIVIVRGVGGSSSGVSGRDSIDIIKDIGRTVTEEGVETPKLYMAKNEYALATDVRVSVYVTGEDGTEVLEENKLIPSAQLLSGVVGEKHTNVKLESGVVIQYTLNNDDQISALRFVSKWDSASSENVPLFKPKTTTSNYILASISGPTNLVVGTVDRLDFETRQMYYTVPDRTAPVFAYQDGDDVIIYDTAKNKATIGSTADIVPGDVFVMNVDNFFTPQTVIIFR